jgi:putative ribosome biogenesis GTPase RsgA
MRLMDLGLQYVTFEDCHHVEHHISCNELATSENSNIAEKNYKSYLLRIFQNLNVMDHMQI